MINRLKARRDHCENLALPPMNFRELYFVLQLSQNCCNWYMFAEHQGKSSLMRRFPRYLFQVGVIAFYCMMKVVISPSNGVLRTLRAIRIQENVCK